ncbi:MAG TPA: MGMT family protein [Clostridiaceae bacterium]|nr:MGMT family protein [Clostridiaceae bacterium]
MAKKTYNEKLQFCGDMPKIEEITDLKSIERFGGTRMLIAPPLEYDEVMRKIPKGKVITSDRIRSCLAKKHGADFTCQLTAGIFINIAANASEEREEDKIPYWRTLKKDGELNEKYPGGIEVQKALLEEEGHEVLKKGKRYYVKDFEEKLFIIT